MDEWINILYQKFLEIWGLIQAEVAKRAKELFESSKLAEKQQLLNLAFSNLKLDGKKLLVTLREPFLTLCAMSHQPANLRMLDSN